MTSVKAQFSVLYCRHHSPLPSGSGAGPFSLTDIQEIRGQLPMKCICVLLFVCSISILVPSQSKLPGSAVTPIDAKTQVKVLDDYGKLPLTFEANRGQTDSRVEF